MRKSLLGFSIGVCLFTVIAYLITVNTTMGPAQLESKEELVVVEDLTVELINAQGKKIGTATLKEGNQGVLIYVQAEGLTPGLRGFHIHEQVFQGTDFNSAGSHFNPTEKEHGRLNPKGYHLGDLGNLTVSQEGRVNQEVFAPGVTLREGQSHSILGRSLIIHAEKDDEVTDPAGNAGDRIAGGNILR